MGTEHVRKARGARARVGYVCDGCKGPIRHGDWHTETAKRRHCVGCKPIPGASTLEAERAERYHRSGVAREERKRIESHLGEGI